MSPEDIVAGNGRLYTGAGGRGGTVDATDLGIWVPSGKPGE